MKTLREQWGSETAFTRHLANDIDSLNKINDLIGLPRILRAVNEFSILNGSIDVVGYTAKGHIVVYEHQDLNGRADQVHVSKTIRYANALHVTGFKVLASILLCESVDQQYLEEFKSHRWSYEKRPSYNGHANVHIIKSQWSDTGDYTPILFDDSQMIKKEENTLMFYKSFIDLYACEWIIQREETNGNAITLWHRILELPTKYMAYVHTLKNEIKIGLHCLKDCTPEDDALLQSILPPKWIYRNSARDRRTIEFCFPKDANWKDIWLETEILKQRIRLILQQQKIN